jgi:hypothetical protein
MKNEDFFGVGLPKWPAMFVSGKTVTKEQAKEIIRRTDNFFYQGVLFGFHKNDPGAAILSKFGLPNAYNLPVDTGDQGPWFKEWGTIECDYIANDWVDSSYIGGPKGWCSPDGTISYFLNVGKWPEVSELFKDWKRVAEAFPFLDLTVTFGSEEYCVENNTPILQFVVKDGEVTIRNPPSDFQFPNFAMEKAAFNENLDNFIEGAVPSRCGVPSAWLDEWAEKSKGILTKLESELP